MTKMTATEAATLYEAAHEAGLAAFHAARPIPMVVGQSTTLFGTDIDYTKPTEYVADGVCGFAWVMVRPARGAFVKYCKEHNLGYTDTCSGGFRIRPRAEASSSQSMQRKEAYCTAFAKVLGEAGVRAYMDSRID